MRLLLLSLILSITYNFAYSQNVNQGLVGYWPMNCNLLDSTDNFNHGIMVGDIQCDPNGRLREAMELDGEEDYIRLPENEALRYVSSNGFSWSIWFKAQNISQTNETGIDQVLMSFLDAELANDIYLGFGTPNVPKDRISFVVDAPGGAGNSAQANDAVMSWKPVDGFENDKWYHACGVRDYDNNEVMLYVDGIKVDSAFFFEAAFDEPQPMQIGVFYDTLITDHYFEGSIDEIRVYDRVLTDREVLILATARPEQIIPDTSIANFGNIKCKADSTYLIQLRNEGPSEFDISNIRLVNGEAFSINLTNTFTMLDQEVVDLEILFDPPSQDEFFDTLFLENTFGVQPLIIYMEGSKEVLIDIIDTLDFGEIVNCENRTSIDSTIEITNVNIDSLEISQFRVNSGPFKITSVTREIMLGETKVIPYAFEPNELGEFFDSLIVEFSNCDLSYTVFFKGKHTFPDALYPNTIDMGASEIGLTSSQTFSFVNTGTTTLEYQTQRKTGTEFSINKLSNFDEIVPGDSIIFNVDFDPSGGFVQDTLFLISSLACGERTDTVLLQGIGQYRATFDISLMPFTAEVGDKKELILDLNNKQQFDLAQIDSMDIEVTLNRSVLILDDDNESINENLEYHTIPFTIVTNSSNESESIKLDDLTVVLGNRSIDSLLVEVVDLYGQLANVNVINNTFQVDQICESGTTKRLFIADEWLDLQPVVPNPANDQIQINFSLLENGPTSIYLIDTFGNKIKEFFNQDLQEGTYQADYSIADIPSGTFFLILQTPNQQRTTRLIKF